MFDGFGMAGAAIDPEVGGFCSWMFLHCFICGLHGTSLSGLDTDPKTSKTTKTIR